MANCEIWWGTDPWNRNSDEGCFFTQWCETVDFHLLDAIVNTKKEKFDINAWAREHPRFLRFGKEKFRQGAKREMDKAYKNRSPAPAAQAGAVDMMNLVQQAQGVARIANGAVQVNNKGM